MKKEIKKPTFHPEVEEEMRVFEELLKKIVSNDNEIFEELISLMHIFSTTMYSKRRKNKINIYKQDIENFIQPDK